MTEVTVVVPAYDEASRIGPVVRELVGGYEVLVVDDGSTDGTADEARAAGARVVEQPENRGYVAALKRGFREARADVVVTFDADGEFRAEDVARLAEPVLDGRLDLVFGARPSVVRPSERLLNAMARLRVDVTDSASGLRALRRELAVELDLDAACTCGTFALEAAAKGARVGEVGVGMRAVEKPRGSRVWTHTRQIVHVLRYLLRV